jgi:DNA-binding response OmpR family regulator
MSDISSTPPNSAPTVYFIDDSATMREVVKIAFRRESFNVITCADVTSAIAQFEQVRPDAIVSDVIMPDRDGYQLCEYVKQHAVFGSTPVILLSGVVNRDVADKAHQVRADELIRKPFHPQQLVACVKKLLNPGMPEVQSAPASHPAPAVAPAPASAGPNPLNELFGTLGRSSSPAAPPAQAKAAATVNAPAPAKPVPQPASTSAAEVTKLRAEIRRLESLVKKLQSQLDTEHEYCAALESQLRTINVAE